MKMRCFATMAAALLSLACASPALATTRYAVPDDGQHASHGGGCAIDHPCTLQVAVTSATPFDDVDVAPGDYPLQDTLFVQQPNQRITIHGEAGKPRPVIYLASTGTPFATIQAQAGTVLRHLDIRSAIAQGSTLVLFDTTVEDSIIRAATPGTFDVTLKDGSAIRNSWLRMDSPNVGGVEADRGSDELRNVTISGVSGAGIPVLARCRANPDLPNNAITGGQLTIINTIALTDTANVLLADGSGCQGHTGFLPSISAQSSSFDPFREFALAGGTYDDLQGNVGPATLNADGIHEVAGSSSIDAGKVDALSATDIDGEARVQGAAVDIGADEFVPAPAPTVTPASTTVTPVYTSPVAPVIITPASLPKGLSALSATGTKSTSKTPPKIHFTLSDNAKIPFKLQAVLPGRIRGGHCVAPAKKGTPCTATRTINTGTITAAKGRNDISLLTSGSRQLSPGVYRVTVSPPGQRAQAVRFRVTSGKKKS